MTLSTPLIRCALISANFTPARPISFLISRSISKRGRSAFFGHTANTWVSFASSFFPPIVKLKAQHFAKKFMLQVRIPLFPLCNGSPLMAVSQNEKEDSDESEEESQYQVPAMPTDMQSLGYSFPFPLQFYESADDVRRSLKSCLPSPIVVRHIVDMYYTEASWM